MPGVAAIRPIVALSVALLAVRLASAIYVRVPGYTDAYYYVDVATRFAHGQGLTADFVWNFIEAPDLAALPVASHRFWMPLATAIQAIGIAIGGPLLGELRAAQAAVIAVAALIPALAHRAARELGAGERAALVCAAVVGLGGLFAPAWVTLDAFAPAAVIGTCFFLAYARAARGSMRAGVAAGLLVGLLYLARAEGALFGLALLALVTSRESRRAGTLGSAVAVAIGLGWLARDLSVGLPPDLGARASLLVSYQDFFALRSPTLEAYLAAMPVPLTSKLLALTENAVTGLFAFLVVGGPLAVYAAVARRRDPAVGAWLALVVVVYLAQSLVWTLHSRQNSYFHSLAAFVPFGAALAASGVERALARRPHLLAPSAVGALALAAVVSGGAIVGWSDIYARQDDERAAAVDALPEGTILAIDAAAWRWISGRPALVTPPDAADALCVIARYDARALVLERAHFSAYDDLYDERAPLPRWLGRPIVRGDIHIFPVVGSPPCPR